jgi:hypothetical protein
MALKHYDKLKRAVRRWLLRALPTCRQTVETASQSMERQLTPSERIKLKLHFWVCAWCRWYLEHLQLIRDASREQARTDEQRHSLDRGTRANPPSPH